MDISLYAISIWVVPVLLAMTLHESGHAYVAWRLGDDTAYRLGRVSLNPFKHIDPMGTVILPLMLLVASNFQFTFGWAKPVPVRFDRLRNPRRDMVWVAAAGPAANLLLAVASAFLLRLLTGLPPGSARWTMDVLFSSILINMTLAVFNMLPIPPLDGGRVVTGLLPRSLALPFARLERWGLMFVVVVLLVVPYLDRQLGWGLHITRPITRFIYAAAGAIMSLAGLRF